MKFNKIILELLILILFVVASNRHSQPFLIQPTSYSRTHLDGRIFGGAGVTPLSVVNPATPTVLIYHWLCLVCWSECIF